MLRPRSAAISLVALAVERMAHDHARAVRRAARARRRPCGRTSRDGESRRRARRAPAARPGSARSAAPRAMFSEALRAIRYSHGFSANGALPPVSAAWALMNVCWSGVVGRGGREVAAAVAPQRPAVAGDDRGERPLVAGAGERDEPDVRGGVEDEQRALHDRHQPGSGRVPPAMRPWSDPRRDRPGIPPPPQRLPHRGVRPLNNSFGSTAPFGMLRGLTPWWLRGRDSGSLRGSSPIWGSGRNRESRDMHQELLPETLPVHIDSLRRAARGMTRTRRGRRGSGPGHAAEGARPPASDRPRRRRAVPAPGAAQHARLVAADP